MPRRKPSRPDHRRAAIAQEAARIIQEHGLTNFRSAKEKAGVRLGLEDRGALPSNLEIDSAIAEHNRIFRADDHDELLRAQRRVAVEVMRGLEEFSPRLVGTVLTGNTSDYSVIEFHAFSDAAEAVGAALDRLGLANRPFEQRLRLRRDRSEPFPGYRFACEGFDCAVTVFPERGRGNAPLSAVNGRPMRRATAKDVETLLSAEGDGDS
ncbi:MAG: hypothetical protein L6Q83_11735 [Gammaproteobacteria bacterium]|nr:hypothetical protein [Gammaproteobacteria bacterium]